MRSEFAEAKFKLVLPYDLTPTPYLSKGKIREKGCEKNNNIVFNYRYVF